MQKKPEPQGLDKSDLLDTDLLPIRTAEGIPPAVCEAAPTSCAVVMMTVFQNQVRIAPIMFLLPWLGGPNLGRMTNQAFDSHLFHEVHEPLHRSRGFDPHSHRVWKQLTSAEVRGAYRQQRFAARKRLRSRREPKPCGA
jgi:hypothetical protein